jgi:hypothetical protein
MRRSMLCADSAVVAFNRMIALRRLLLRLPLLIGLALCAPAAHAACNSFSPPPELYVGDTNINSPTYDPACTQNDIQSAIDAATCIYGTRIFITREHTYTTQGLSISNKNVTLVGRGDGAKCGPDQIVICDPMIGCAPPPTAPLVTLSGKSGSPVIAIVGTSKVYLQYLDIRNGSNAGNSGGGVYYQGSGSLTLDTSWVRFNQANQGGGVYFDGTGGTAAPLNVLAHSEIFSNSVDDSGGGILVAGNAVLNILQPQTLIELNEAPNGDGGGIAVFGPAQANIGSTGVKGSNGYIGVVSNNTAAYGGGIALISGSNDGDYPFMQLFTTDALRPVEITSNTASHTGGGIYLKGYYSALPTVANYARLCAWDFRIADNIAQEGAAIYGDVDSGLVGVGSFVELGGCYLSGQPLPNAPDAVACANSALCNTIEDNAAADPTQGSAILVQDAGLLNANRFSMRNNNVAHAIRIVGDGTPVFLSDCLLAGNTSAQELIYLTGSATPLTIEACTFANNTIGAAHVIHTESDFSINDSIIAEPGTFALDYAGDPANFAVHYVVSNDITTLGGAAPGVIQGTPTFVDLAGGDYHLRPGQYLGIDLAPIPSGFDRTQGVDLDGKPRNTDLPTVVNAYGPRDLGAYELQNLFAECGTTDSLFCNGFDH